MIDPHVAIEAREHRNQLVDRISKIASMDPVAALEIIEEVTREFGHLHFELVIKMLGMKLGEKPSVAALLVKMGPESAWEVEGYLDRDGHEHPVPVVDPLVPSSFTEDRWWEQIDEYIAVLWDIPVDGRVVTERKTRFGHMLVVRPGVA